MSQGKVFRYPHSNTVREGTDKNLERLLEKFSEMLKGYVQIIVIFQPKKI